MDMYIFENRKIFENENKPFLSEKTFFGKYFVFLETVFVLLKVDVT